LLQLRELSKLWTDSDATLKLLFSLVLCVPASSAPVERVQLSDEPGEDVEQSVGKPYVLK